MTKSFILDNFKGGGIYSFVGGGGKTSIIKEVARVLRDAGYSVTITTTTKFGKDEFKDYDFSNNFLDDGLKVVIKEVEEKKLIGFSKKELEGVGYIPLDKIILVEADGSRRMPIKVPYSHEPVIPNNSRKVFLVIGGSVVGKDIGEDNTYNLELIKSGAKESSYTPLVLKEIVSKYWVSVLKDFNWHIVFNQGDLLVDVEDLGETFDFFKYEFGVYTYVVSTNRGEVYFDNSYKLGALILAAGSGSRMGSPKQLLEYEGMSFLENAIRKYSGFSSKIVVTLGYYEEEIKGSIEEIGFSFKEIEGFKEGMGSSFRESYKEFLDCDGLLVTPCDLPLTSWDVISSIILEFIREGKTIIPLYKGKKGHPSLFSRRDLDMFSKIKGDEGGRSIIKELDLIYFDVDDSSIVYDIDTREEYERLKES